VFAGVHSPSKQRSFIPRQHHSEWLCGLLPLWVLLSIMSSRATKLKSENFEKNVTKRGNIPTTQTKKSTQYPVSGWVLGLLIFVVVGSALFQIIRTTQSIWVSGSSRSVTTMSPLSSSSSSFFLLLTYFSPCTVPCLTNYLLLKVHAGPASFISA